MALLRTVIGGTDAVAGALLYGAVDRGWGDRLAAAFAVAIYHLMPLDFGVLVGRQPDQRLCAVGVGCRVGAR